MRNGEQQLFQPGVERRLVLAPSIRQTYGPASAHGETAVARKERPMNERWIPVAKRSAVATGTTLLVDMVGEPVCLYNLNGTIYATQDICSHQEASLADGFIEGDCIECPLHQALFHIPTGQARTAPATINLKTYEVRIDGDDVQLHGDDA